MRVRIGDRLIMDGVRVGDPKRVGVIAAVPHLDGSPPYTVRWLESGRETLVFPGLECHIESTHDSADGSTHDSADSSTHDSADSSDDGAVGARVS